MTALSGFANALALFKVHGTITTDTFGNATSAAVLHPVICQLMFRRNGIMDLFAGNLLELNITGRALNPNRLPVGLQADTIAECLYSSDLALLVTVRALIDAGATSLDDSAIQAELEGRDVIYSLKYRPRLVSSYYDEAVILGQPFDGTLSTATLMGGTA